MATAENLEIKEKRVATSILMATLAQAEVVVVQVAAMEPATEQVQELDQGLARVAVTEAAMAKEPAQDMPYRAE